MSVTERRADLPLIRASEWNAMLDRLERRLNVRVSAARPPQGYPHPWKVRGRWSDQRQAWEIRLVPAYVNAGEVLCPAMRRADAPAATRARETRGSRLRPWLSERPWMPVGRSLFRAIGSDADPARDPEAIPGYFAARGVGEGPTLRVDEIGGVSIVPATVADPKALRRLRACDLVLTVPKPAVRVEIETDPRGITRIRPALVPADGQPSLRLTPRYVPQIDSVPLQAQLVAGLSDPPDYERLVASLYFLSPAGAASGSAPAAGWTFHAEQILFWDYYWAWKADLYQFPEQTLGLVPGLAGGAGQGIVDQILGDLARADAAASAALQRASVTIAEWTL